MAIVIGQQLGSYEITALLGKGGMGEVYRARDARLKREVAIKILPDEFSRDAERISRFQREAQVLASLNHPNVAGIHDLQEEDNTRFLVLELVEGETLADVIARRGALPVAEALSVATQIGEALEAAHELGIVHRDLKPANVKITPDGKVKVLDFGLSKAIDTTAVASTLSNSPTLVSATNGAVIIGTAAYMSPEQARGRPVDQRSDVFSFGCVLYEMLTGQQAFRGEDASEIVAAVIKSDADLSLLPANLNLRLHELLNRCLAKNRKDRWQAIGDVRIEIARLVLDPGGHKLPPYESRPRALATWVVCAILIAVISASVTTWIVWSLRPAATALVARFSYVLPEEQAFSRAGRHLVALSPDGTKAVYVADRQLYLKSLDEMVAKPISGTAEDVDTPFFSPDSKSVAFHSVSERKLKKIAVTGGASVTICDLELLPYGASWATDGNIFLGAGLAGIQRVSADGGTCETIVNVEPNQIGQSPQLLPDGQTILFTIAANTGNDRWDKAQIVAHSLKTGERKTIINGGSDARFVSTGHIVYAVGNTLFAVPFDSRKLLVTGGPVPVLEGALRPTSGAAGAANYGFSDNGSLVWIQGIAGFSADERYLVLVDLNGKRKPLDLRPASYLSPRFSPDGKQLAVVISDGREFSIWIHDLSGAVAPRRLTFGGRNGWPLWTTDGHYIVFASEPDTGPRGIFRQRSDGNGAIEMLTATEMDENHSPESWSPDGNVLTFLTVSPQGRGIWTLSVNGDRKPKPLIVGNPIQGTSSFSPDGRWLAYSSSENGPPEIFVQAFPLGAKYQITVSTLGASNPVWSPDGKQLFFLEAQIGGGRSRIVSVDVRTQPSFTFGQPKPLPIERIRQVNPLGGPNSRAYDISPDGTQFVVMYAPTEVQPDNREHYQINFVLNWFEELKQRLPVH